MLILFKNKISNLLSLEPVVDNHQLEPIIETKLKPGDLLYVPSRHYHCALPKSPRLSISIPCLSLNPAIIQTDPNTYKI